MGNSPRQFLLLSCFLFLLSGFGSARFTERQLETFKKYLGKTYWVIAAQGNLPSFFSAPSPSATRFFAQAGDSFQITEMVEGSSQRPYYYYRARFNAGREGYIDIDSFLEQLNLTLLTVDPDRGQKIAAARVKEEESRREARIRAQPWPEHIKEAVLNRQAVLGMNTREAREALGKPTRVVKIQSANPLTGQREQWIYQSGPVLTFTNGLITRIQPVEGKSE